MKEKQGLLTTEQQNAGRQKKRPVLIDMPPALLSDLDSAAATEEESRSAIVRQAIRDYLKRRGSLKASKQKGSQA